MKYIKWLPAALISAALLTGCNDTEYVHVGPNWDTLWNLETAGRQCQSDCQSQR